MPNVELSIIQDPQRLAELTSLCLLDTVTDPAFDRLTNLAAEILDAPVALVSLVDVDRQFFKSQVGLPSPWSETRQTPLSHSFCKHTVITREPLIVDDARLHPLVKDNLAIRDLNVIAYAGIPLTTSSGYEIGSFCVIDTKPRVWTERQIHILSELAKSVMTEIELRQEIQERQRVEDALLESDARHHLIMNSMDEGVVLQDRDGVIYACNPGAERILGLTVDQMRGRTSVDPRWRAIHEDGSPFPGETHPPMMVLKTGKTQSNIVMGVHKPDGVLTWILINSQPLIQQGETEPYAALSTFVDITERKVAEKQALMLHIEEERVKLLSNFIQNSSHEFRTPIAVIQMCLDLINKSPDPERKKHKLGKIEEQINRIDKLVDMLQMMSQLDSQLSYEHTSVDINLIIDEVTSQFRYADQKDIRFKLDLQETLPSFDGSSDLLQDAIVQLLDNAVRYTPAKGNIDILTDFTDSNIHITIRDTGDGIPEDAMPRVFERFFRLDTAHSTPGFGLGLPIVRSIVELHGGTIDIKSQVGTGTTVSIVLPVQALLITQ